MSLQDSLFSEDVECDVTVFSRDGRRKRVLIFPPVNNYRRFIIHQLVQDRFPALHTFSIGQGNARRTVVCYKTDLIRDPKLNGVECKQSSSGKDTDSQLEEMGVEGQRSTSASPERGRVTKSVKPAPKVEIYRPPAARRARNEASAVEQSQPQPQPHPQPQPQPGDSSCSSTRSNRQKRPDRAVYVPRHRRSLDPEGSPQPAETPRHSRGSRENSTVVQQVVSKPSVAASKEDPPCLRETQRMKKDVDVKEIDSLAEKETSEPGQCSETKNPENPVENKTTTEPEEEDKRVNSVEENVPTESNDSMSVEVECERRTVVTEPVSKSVSESTRAVEPTVDQFVNSDVSNDAVSKEKCKNNSLGSKEQSNEPVPSRDELANQKNAQMIRRNLVSDVLIISDKEPKVVKEVAAVSLSTPPEKKVKKVERPKSKPAPPPSPPVKINRDECDWDSLFDDNGDCLDPTLIEELTSAVGEVVVEQPKSDYKAYTKHVEVSSDEFAHVVEIYNFPSEFKTSDLAAVFSPFKSGGFELKWVDDTHCLGVFSSPLIAAEVLASDHPFVKTRPLSEATALSKTKAKRIAEFLQPYRSRPETCAALARRLVTGALGVKLATARQEREHEKNVLREAKEKRRLANKQREDAWEGIIPEK